MFHTITLSKADPTPLYIQLAAEMAKLIQADILPSGTKLPPIRVLSKQLSINRDTVVSAYNLLENQGLVEAHVGKGTYVTSNIVVPSAPPFSENNNIYCSTLGFSKDLFPVSLCRDLAGDIISKEGWNAFCDPLNRERNMLKQSASQFLEEMGIRSSSAQIRIIKHFTDFLSVLSKFSCKQGICIEAFSDLTYSSFMRSVGSKIYEVPLTSEGINLGLLEKHLKTGTISYIFLSPYLQNPTGLCYTESNKQKILELAEAYDCYIVEDGTLSDFLYDSIPFSPLFNHSFNDRVIYTYHFSKVYLPYLSYSFVLLPSPLLKTIKDDLECGFNEYFLHYYLNSKILKNTQHTLFESCKEKYLYLRENLAPINDKLEIFACHGGLSFWLKPLTLPCETLCNLFIQHNIVVSPGTLFTSSNKNDYLRLSISHLSMKHINQILILLNAVLK